MRSLRFAIAGKRRPINVAGKRSTSPRQQPPTIAFRKASLISSLVTRPHLNCTDFVGNPRQSLLRTLGQHVATKSHKGVTPPWQFQHIKQPSNENRFREPPLCL